MTNEELLGRLAVLEMVTAAALREAIRSRPNLDKPKVIEAIRGPAISRLSPNFVEDPTPETSRQEGLRYLDYLLANFAEHLIPPTK